ncbi:LCP family protein [Streptomyces sp. NBC_01278]|uniref:LCP family protein n=1 Tax=unclassified Streptomyces TaxID=2593676 RepID=UPI002E35DC4C|nr:LCP family protein [Streptomyces sp. NBC_01278]
MSAHRRKTSRPARRPRRQRHRPRRTARTLLVAVCALAAVAAAGAWYAYRDLAGSIGSSKALHGAEKSKHGDTNILLMGLDSRRDQNGEKLPEAVLDKLHAGSSDIGGYNANTLILLHVPGDGSRAKAFSVPRDDFVDLPGRGKDKIKKAYGLAKAAEEERLTARGVEDARELERAGREAGRTAQIETVRNFLGVPIDHFAELNLAGFYHLADALGGVPVCLKKPVRDAYSGADFPAGRQSLNGQQSLAFVRQRHGLDMGDLDRTKRQQAFLAGAAQKLNSAGTFTDPVKLMKLVDAAKQDVVTDEGWDLLAFVKQAKNLSGGKVAFTTLPVERFGRNHGEDINVVDDMKIKRLIAEQIGPQASASATAPGSSDAPGTPPAPGASGASGAAGSGPAPDPAAPDPTAPAGASSSPARDGGGIPCVD